MPVLTANSSLLTYSSKLYEVLQYYFAPSSTDSESVDVPNSLYAFLGRITPWPDPFNPPPPTQDQYSIKETFRNIIAAKKIISSDISPVIPRRDWDTGTIYDYYDENEQNLIWQEIDFLNQPGKLLTPDKTGDENASPNKVGIFLDDIYHHNEFRKLSNILTLNRKIFFILDLLKENIFLKSFILNIKMI